MTFTLIGQTSAVMAEAGSAVSPEWQIDGESGNTQYPYGKFKPLATMGEVDASRADKSTPADLQALTGVPDGSGAWLVDNDTVRIAYQSESQGSIMPRTPTPQTYPQTMQSGVTFTGSKIHYIDYDRAQLADYLEDESTAASMVKGSGFLFDKVFNVFGLEVTPKGGQDPLSSAWGTQVKPNGKFVDFVAEDRVTEADFMFNSFCGSWFEPAEKWGEGRGFVDDLWLNSEEWNVADAEAFGQKPEDEPKQKFTQEGGGKKNWNTSGRTMGLASLVTDVNSGTAYTAPALGQTGYEKLVPLNPQSDDFVVIALSGYNYYNPTAPIRLYVGRKGYAADGQVLDASTSSDVERFLGRNGLLHGQIYGLSVSSKVANGLGLDDEFWTSEVAYGSDNANFNAYQKSSDSPAHFKGRFYPTDFKWGGFDQPVSVVETEMLRWTEPESQPAYDPVTKSFSDDGHFFLNGSYKMEHSAPDPDVDRTRFVQNMTGNDAILGFDLHKIERQLRKNDLDGDLLPDFLDVKAKRVLSGEDGSLTLQTGGQGLAHSGENNPDGTLTAATHLGEDGEARMEDPDGLAWIKGSDGDILIVDEDSKNPYGERKFVLPLDSKMNLRDEATGYFLAMAGGKNSPRMAAEATALGGTFYEDSDQGHNYRDAEFSSSWDLTGLLAKKPDGTFYSKNELAGRALFEIQEALPLNEHALMGVVQMRGEAAGQVEAMQADGGGQLLMFNVDFAAMG